MFPGGVAGKLGNRYEAYWLVRQLLGVIGGSANSIRFEGIAANFVGFECAVERGDTIEWHQTKANSPKGNWTVLALEREGVWAAFKTCLNADRRNRCVFISQDSANAPRTLAEDARFANSSTEFRQALGNDRRADFDSLVTAWKVDFETAFDLLRRCEFVVFPQKEMIDYISRFAEIYFVQSISAFDVLRDFLELRMNKKITTESARNEIRAEHKLVLKDWSLDRTLRERLVEETNAYLGTYNPFGAGGSGIPRVEVDELVSLIENVDGPRVIFLTGSAGSGKSGVVRQLIRRLTERSVPHLALRIDQHLDCSSPSALGKEIISREESPAATLKGLAPDKTSVLIVDQVDAVSEVSGRNGAVRQAVLRLIGDARAFNSVRVVAVCRKFDLESDEQFKSLINLSGVERIEVPTLNWEKIVEPFLVSKGIEIADLSDKERDLLCLPLNLSIFLEVVDDKLLPFKSTSDLFARLIEKKGRSISVGRSLNWDLIAPLSKLAEWMSEHQTLDAPKDSLLDFNGALDILRSEGLVVQSRQRISFFHESFFDYVYARTFCNRTQSIESLLLSYEQHLFRRTQVRQILEALRQTDLKRYLAELRIVLTSNSIRYHIKLAIAQWLRSLLDPIREERDIALSLDVPAGPVPQLVRSAILGRSGWFDTLNEIGWIHNNLFGDVDARLQSTFWWLSDLVDVRPKEIAELLDRWWQNSPKKSDQLLSWFGFARRRETGTALVALLCRVIRSNPSSLFASNRPSNLNMVLQTWVKEGTAGAAEILKAYFDAWFSANPNDGPFDHSKFQELDTYTFGEIAKKAPLTFIEGTIDAFVRSIDAAVKNKILGNYDSSFRFRSQAGNHFGSDAFLALFRSALIEAASKSPDDARIFLKSIDPTKHEVSAHIWLETITANGPALADLLVPLLGSPFIFEAGWDGAKWKSFADAARASLPYLDDAGKVEVEKKILSHNPELATAIELARRLKTDGEDGQWRTHNRFSHLLNFSGHVQWCVLEGIGESLLSNNAKNYLAQLRRKFHEAVMPTPLAHEAHWVQSPIKTNQAARMSDENWLSAMRSYGVARGWRFEDSSISGGAEELAVELRRLAKEQPQRFVHLMEQIPDDAPHTYISNVLWGLAESGSNQDNDTLRRAILNAHARPNRPFGTEIVRLFEQNPDIAADGQLFDMLVWYVENGEASDDKHASPDNREHEFPSFSELVNRAGDLHLQGINSTRGRAVEALAKVIWRLPSVVDKAMQVLEKRVTEESLFNVRCCLMRPIVATYNHDRMRCAAMVEQLTEPTSGKHSNYSEVLEKMWLWFSFPPKVLPKILKRTSIWMSGLIAELTTSSLRSSVQIVTAKYSSPLVTWSGVTLLPLLLIAVPVVGRKLLHRLLITGDETTRLVGAWSVLRVSFQRDEYSLLADVLTRKGVTYRRLLAEVAANSAIHDEFRYLAEGILIRLFDDEKSVRRHASEVFRFMGPDDLQRYKDLCFSYLQSKALLDDSFAFFHALKEAKCRVDDLAVPAAERLVAEIECRKESDGPKMTDIHMLQEIIKREYSLSEGEPNLRKRLLDLIDKMLALELHGTDEIIKAHER